MAATDYPTTPGIHRLTTPGPAGQAFDYTIRIPPVYDRQGATPVVLCLHFGGQPSAFYGATFLELIAEPGFRTLPAILVAPTSPYGDWTVPQSEALVDTVLTEVEHQLHVARECRVVMGYSLGGIGAWHFAATCRQRWAAAIPVAGAPRQAPLQPLRDLPLYVIHSRVDRIVPIDDDARAVAQLQELGAPVTFADLPSGDHFDYRLVIAELRDQVVPWLEGVWQQR